MFSKIIEAVPGKYLVARVNNVSLRAACVAPRCDSLTAPARPRVQIHLIALRIVKTPWLILHITADKTSDIKSLVLAIEAFAR